MPSPPLRLIVGAVLLLAVFFGWQAMRWSGEDGAIRAQEKFIASIEDRRWGKVRAMISETYSDRWGFSREDVAAALRDVGGQFVIHLQIDWYRETVSSQEGLYQIVGRMQIDGRGGPAAELILHQGRAYLNEAFTFHWRREGLMPWKWKLVKMEHPTVEVPPGYQPGDLNSLAAPF